MSGVADGLRASRRAVLGGGATAGALSLLGGRAGAAAPRGFSVLVFSRTTGFRHASIETGVETIRQLGAEHGFTVHATEDPAIFASPLLDRFATVVFLNTTGTVLDTEEQRRGLRRHVRRGGGWVGVHSAADTEYDWPFYADLVAAHFKCHPVQQAASFDREGGTHPATAHLPERFPVFDEFYSFRTNPRPDVQVLLTIDESTYLADPNTSNIPFQADGTFVPGFYPGETGYMGDHPMSWCHANLGGQVFYTALGHEAYLYFTDWFRRHLLGGILSTVPTRA